MTYRPFVSIVVCVNRNPLIFRACLKSLQEQTYPRDLYEVILVDATESSQAERLFPSYNLKTVKAKSKSVGAMLNVGTKVAKGEIVARTDADCIVDANWLSKLVDGFSEPQVAGVGGNVIMDGKPCNDLYAQGRTDNKGYLLFDKNNLMSASWPIRIPHFLGANYALRKLILEREGYHIEVPPDVGCEDMEICVRLLSRGYKLKFVNAVVYHPARSTKSQLTNGVRDGRAIFHILKWYEPTLIRTTYFRLITNIIWDKGSILMLFGFIDEAGKHQITDYYK